MDHVGVPMAVLPITHDRRGTLQLPRHLGERPPLRQAPDAQALPEGFDQGPLHHVSTSSISSSTPGAPRASETSPHSTNARVSVGITPAATMPSTSIFRRQRSPSSSA